MVWLVTGRYEAISAMVGATSVRHFTQIQGEYIYSFEFEDPKLYFITFKDFNDNTLKTLVHFYCANIEVLLKYV